MESVDSVREDILRIRGEIATASCSQVEEEFDKIQKAVGKVMMEKYGGSSILYVLSCVVNPLMLLFICMLLYASATIVKKRLLLKRVSRQLRRSPFLEEEFRVRKLSQASRRSARQRSAFIVTVKCIVATSVLIVFMGLRMMLELGVRGWLKEVLAPSEGISGGIPGAAEDSLDVWEVLYDEIASFLRLGWFRDVQALFIFSSVGSSVLVFGLRLLRSAYEDSMTLRSSSASSLQLLQKLDDRYALDGQILMQKHLTDLFSLLSDCMVPPNSALENENTDPNASFSEEEEEEETVAKENKKGENEQDAMKESDALTAKEADENEE